MQSLNRKCISQAFWPSSLNAGIIALGNRSSFETENDCSHEFSVYQRKFKPFHLVSRLTEPGTMIKRAVFFIFCNRKLELRTFLRQISNSAKYLELSDTWLCTLTSTIFLYKKLLNATGTDKILSYHPTIVGLESLLNFVWERS